MYGKSKGLKNDFLERLASRNKFSQILIDAQIYLIPVTRHEKKNGAENTDITLP